MSIPFPSDAWIKAMMEDLNQSQAYAEAAKNWEGDFYFIIEPGGNLDRTVILYMDLWHGKCREAFEVTDPEARKPAFRLSGPVQTWKKVMTRQLDPMQAMMTGQLRLQGNMAMVMKNVRAAKELVESCTRIPTIFPV
ncbi:SCP2 sterol-binding domain-containing protein [uncultured Thermanaerothrix sp.]|uniref:SCP2 sterol-binding domain-containing protein n=1 Tax=uncultured Thermanaerothrix sp. TaxID=1195149 RepID=UPI0026279375|nr:SCP2 sterol-binding domain-containing protein [uncultured Thermanaerothrix sp.]